MWLSLKKQNKKISEQQICNLILSKIENSTCKVEDSIGCKDLYNIGLIPYYDSGYGNYLIEFTKNNKKYAFCNIDLKLSIDSDSVEIYEKEIFKGQVYIFDCKKKVDDYIRIISSFRDGIIMNKNLNNIKRKTQDEKSIKTEDKVFNENFEVYSPNEHYSFYFLNSKMMEDLNKIRGKYNLFNIYISENKIILIIDSNKTLFDFSYINDEQELNKKVEEDVKELLETINDFEEILNK